jgi:exopolysaccharide biosynthesis polyprenyl glycosylphosphotransferase
VLSILVRRDLNDGDRSFAMAVNEGGEAAGPGRRFYDVPETPAPKAPFAQSRLRYALQMGDAASLATAQLLALAIVGSNGSLSRAGLSVLFAVVAGLFILRSQGLFLARVSSIRVVEATRLARATAILGFVTYGVDRLLPFGLSIMGMVLAVAFGLVLLLIERSAYRAWLGWARQSGRFIRKVVIVGADDEAVRLKNLFEVHREIGIEVIGVFGDRSQALRRGLVKWWRGPVSDAGLAVGALGASGVIVCPGTLMSHELNSLIRTLHDQNIHVHLSIGVSGVDTRRLQSLPLAYEPLLYCEPISVNPVHVAAKRLFDVFASAIAIILAAPAMAVIAIVIKLDDRGPILFRQKRVGRHGVEFGVLKFRTMVVDAEARLRELQRANERNGPLFKMERDPRITRVGRFLRSSSLDELPQLFNVFRGEMSLIGPRPALPSEVVNFSDQVRLRERVRPGITGLWQVEARDNPSFDAYQRLDAFYLDNWSILLDLVILIGTIEQVTMRLVATLLRKRREDREELLQRSEAARPSLPSIATVEASSGGRGAAESIWPGAKRPSAVVRRSTADKHHAAPAHTTNVVELGDH